MKEKDMSKTMRSETTKQEALRRLAYIEGHLKGIRKMVEEDQYCVDILKQTYAVQRAIDKFEGLLLQGHLQSCVVDGIHEGREAQVIGELEELFELSQR
jgi:DNA-binding FrmR family transcriptional regulator